MPRHHYNTLSELIDDLGESRIAKACNVCRGTVYHWRSRGLPNNHRRAGYLAMLSDLSNLWVSEIEAIEEASTSKSMDAEPKEPLT